MPSNWHQDMRMFTENEFSDITSPEGIIERDGQLIKGVDDLAAFIEAYLSLKNGIQSQDLQTARTELKEQYKSEVISGFDFGKIYADFD